MGQLLNDDTAPRTSFVIKKVCVGCNYKASFLNRSIPSLTTKLTEWTKAQIKDTQLKQSINNFTFFTSAKKHLKDLWTKRIMPP